MIGMRLQLSKCTTNLCDYIMFPWGGTLAKHVVIHPRAKNRGKRYGFHTGGTDMWTAIRVIKSGKWAKKGKKISV